MSAIDDKYRKLGWLGAPTTPERVAPDGVGRYRHYQNGSIYWHPKTGAREVHGAIRAKWKALGWERSFLGYPRTDETTTPDGRGRFNHFQGGSIYWHPQVGAFEIHGAIREKWKALGWERSFLGYPVTDETATPDGVGCYNHFQGGSIYWRPETGAHEVHGDICQRWAELGWEKGGLGYPKSDERNVTGGGRISRFEHGSIRWQIIDVPNLTFFCQNMALLPTAPDWKPPFIQFPYKGKERDKAIAVLIDKVRVQKPDVVGLGECFVDGERDRIKKALADIYRWSLEGPDEDDLESDGGLLLLSRHPILAQNRTIFRQCKGDDCFANKGVLHARILPSGHPGPYDIFLSHTQNPNDPDPEAARGELQSQLNHISSFVKACRETQYPALLMGDLNTDALNLDLYQDFLARLDYPQDVWQISGDRERWPLGITSDDNKAFSGPERAVDDRARHQQGKRIDYFLSWPGENCWPNYGRTEVVVWQSSPGRDISDHYGLKTRLVSLRQLDVKVQRSINRVTIALNKFHCLEESDEAGSDETYFRLYYQAANGAKGEKKTGVKDDVDSGDIHSYPSPTSLSLGDPGDWLEVIARGLEEDDFPNKDDKLGRVSLRLDRSELLQMFGRPVERTLPRLTGDGSEYVVTVTLSVE